MEPGPRGAVAADIGRHCPRYVARNANAYAGVFSVPRTATAEARAAMREAGKEASE